MTEMKRYLPCGSWPSPFTTTVLTGKNRVFSELRVDGNTLYWLERRPENQGRILIVQWNVKTGMKDVTDLSFSVGNRVHEYGGGSYAVHNGNLVFSDLDTNGIGFIRGQEKPVLIFQNEKARFADFFLTDSHILCVHEDHSQKPVKNSLILFSIFNPGEGKILVEGADFYSCPRLSKDMKRLVWIEWDHPFMPWESTRLCMADFDPVTAAVTHKRVLAGEGQQESLIEPGWTEEGHLFVCSDRTGWWNLYQVDFRNTKQVTLKSIAPVDAEIGKPHWVFGQKSWHIISGDRFIVHMIQQGKIKTALINSHEIREIDLGCPESCPVPLAGGFAWINHPTDQPMEILYQDQEGNRHVLQTASSISIPRLDVSFGQAIAFLTQDRQQAHAFFYPPVNQHCQPCEHELPPLLVLAHGGPTGQSFNSFSTKIQFWTSRGFAVVDVNYRGSTGFGKTYRNALRRKWGDLDVQDCLDACQYLIDQKRVDPKRIVIKGSSAGGFTVLQALTRSAMFAAGSCLYGVGDLTALAKETHKFESYYLTGLIGAYPEEKERYQERSPLTRIHKIQCPIILFQGLKDRVVPPSQAENIVKILKKNHIPYAYYTFPEEGHGFKQETTLKTVLGLELSFFGKVLGFTPYDISENVVIHS